jgi:hypothetical protein
MKGVKNVTMLLVLFVCACGSPSRPACINNILSAVFKHFYPLTSLHGGKQFCPYWAASLDGFLPILLRPITKKRITARCSFLVNTSIGAAIFTPRSLIRKELNTPSDLELQYEQASAVLPITQRKYSEIGDTF